MTLDFKFKSSVVYCVHVAATSSLFTLSLSIIPTFSFDNITTHDTPRLRYPASYA